MEHIAEFLTLETLLWMSVASAIGIFAGAAPGITAALAMALMLPITVGMRPLLGIAILVAIYCGAIMGGSITAILLRMPGTPASIATTFDGFPMARKGMPGKAIATAMLSSLIGGLASGLVLLTVAPLVAAQALRFGPWEYLSLGVFAFSAVVWLGSGSAAKAAVSAVVGLLVAAIGPDPISGVIRMTMGLPLLDAGVNFVPAVIGLFAISQSLKDIETATETADLMEYRMTFSNLFPTLSELRVQITNFLRSSAIGIVIGLLPAIGSTVAGLLSYSQAKQFSKHPEKFGTGILDGIVASETANNAVTGGALTTLMALGVPGDVPTAVLLSGFLIHGLRPGPLLFTDHADIAYGVLAAFFLANILMFVIGITGLRFFAGVARIPKGLLIPVVLMLCVVGAYSLNYRWLDVWTLVFFGLVGYGMEKYGFPLAPMVLGLVLGPVLEQELRRGLMTVPSYLPFFTRPISAAILCLALLVVVVTVWRMRPRASAPSG